MVLLSQKLTAVERNYAIIEKESLVIKWALDSLRYYLLGKVQAHFHPCSSGLKSQCTTILLVPKHHMLSNSYFLLLQITGVPAHQQLHCITSSSKCCNEAIVQQLGLKSLGTSATLTFHLMQCKFLQFIQQTQ